MGLNGLATRNVAGYVKQFRVYGEWKQYDVQEFAKVGRVPDGSMLLNSLVRVAVEKMGVLDSFRYALSELGASTNANALSWELNMKMLPTVWQGIAQSTLTQLTIKFPSMRHPQPITIAPSIPSLKSLKVLEIDPLCYADDISLLLLGSKKLEDLKLHWSPRMKEAREPSINLNTFFGKVVSANCSMPLRSISLQNLYMRNDGSCDNIINTATVREITLINSVAGEGDDAANVFIDSRCHRHMKHDMPELKMFRIDKVSKQQCDFLGSFTGLERLYFIGAQKHIKNQSNSASPRNSHAALLPNSPASSTSSSPSVSDTLGLKDDYLENIAMNHGSTLRHLLLLPQWRLSADNIALLIRKCPHLEQLGLGVDFVDFRHLQLLIPFLPKLKALRLLENPDDPSFGEKVREHNDGTHEKQIGNQSLNREWSVLRYIEIASLLFEIGKLRIPEPAGESGKQKYRRDVRRRSPDTVCDIDIWRMDTLEI